MIFWMEQNVLQAISFQEFGKLAFVMKPQKSWENML
jgi:hypothetical protein